MTRATAPPLRRGEFAVPAGTSYLDTAVMSPLPRRAVEAMAAEAELVARWGSAVPASRARRVEEVRAAAAALMGVADDDVAFVPSTTGGLGLVAAGLDWHPGDAVLLCLPDHPSTVLPWRARADVGVEVVAVGRHAVTGAVDPDAVAAALDQAAGRVRVVALSWVHADTGARADLAALASVSHQAGALLCVDAIQGLGVVPCELAAWGVDAAAAGAQKWMLGPHGVGVALVAAPLRDRLRVLAPGARAVTDPTAARIDPVASARRFEGGALDHVGLAGLGAGLDLLAEAGPAAVWGWVDHLVDRLARGLAAQGAEVRSPRAAGDGSAIVAATVPGHRAEEVVGHLARRDVIVAARGGAVRFAPHGWTTEADVDAALAAVASV